MYNTRFYISLFVIAILCLACNQKKTKTTEMLFDFDSPNQYESDNNVNSKNYKISDRSRTIEVAYKESNGVKIIPVKINNAFEVDMIFDTGTSTTLISLAEAIYLANKGSLKSEDILGVSQSKIADGSIVENMDINLRIVTVADKIIFYNVKATVSANMEAPLLLGNEVLNRVVSYTIDNDNQIIAFQIK